MSKVYTFIELLSEIKGGKIKERTRFKCASTIFEYRDNPNILEDMRGKGITAIWCFDDITDEKYELLEDTTDSIEELDFIVDNRDEKINEIIRKVNQIDKKIKELKDEEND